MKGLLGNGFPALRRRLRRAPVVSVLRLYGAIGVGGRFGPALSDESLAEPVARAFAGRPDAVALAINSPGGSPAQSAMIAARIRRHAERDGIPVYAFCEDVAASGGYWLACAGDEIWADESSILGSIGVIYAGFGVQDLIARHGVERRVHTAGARKAMLDPFRPEDEGDVDRLLRMQGVIHARFKEHVRARRGARLDETAAGPLFEGDVWVGREALAAGLIDGIGHLGPVMEARLGRRVRFRLIGRRRGLMQRLGMPGAADLGDALADRMLWARWGL